ncbi:MAG: 1-acyl-sn-glycerol-3-phosphate acyltransferase [Ruminococcaceae bacterium]|nr:1-acyl-sn-glycerol-3-phosphate acyltransferase [Oscillospiraceae bacterium]
MRKTRYYSSFLDDFEKSADQNFKLPDDYKYIKTSFLSRIISEIIYGTAVVFGGIYCKVFLHMKIKGRKNLKGIKSGFFIYGNHTQPVGDVFIPALCVLPKRIYTVVSPANYGIPVIGKILPYLGALPVAGSFSGIKKLNDAIGTRLEQKHPVVIYPEAHVWEYYTGIRPFPETSFRFPVKFNKPSFAMTVTYRKGKVFKKPVMEVFLDGPFYPEGNNIKEKTEDLHGKVISAMKDRSKNSNYCYITYEKTENK